MQHSKATVEGRDERLRVLQKYEVRVTSLFENALSRTLRKDVQSDDVLDAFVTFVTAEASRGVLTSLVGEPSHDSAGLPIEMLYLSQRDEVT